MGFYLYPEPVKYRGMQEKKIRIGAVSYLNTKPLLYGIKRSPLINDIELVEDHPASIAGMLLHDEIDAGLIPVAVIPELAYSRIISDYCIGSDGPVASVCMFSEVPVNRIQKVLLDYQSRTSAALLQILLKNYWHISPEIVDTRGEEYRHLIRDTTAGLVIGDRAFEQRQKSTYIYDLGEAWKDHTGLNFVFAAWVANKPLPEAFIKAFNEANAMGLSHIPEIIRENPYKLFDLQRYFKYHVNYLLDEKKSVGMEEFIFQLNQLNNQSPVLLAE